jgi:hypothetical protein
MSTAIASELPVALYSKIKLIHSLLASKLLPLSELILLRGSNRAAGDDKLISDASDLIVSCMMRLGKEEAS